MLMRGIQLQTQEFGFKFIKTSYIVISVVDFSECSIFLLMFCNRYIFVVNDWCHMTFMNLLKSMALHMSCTFPKKPDFSEPLISKAYLGSGTRETQYMAL